MVAGRTQQYFWPLLVMNTRSDTAEFMLEEEEVMVETPVLDRAAIKGQDRCHLFSQADWANTVHSPLSHLCSSQIDRKWNHMSSIFLGVKTKNPKNAGKDKEII